MINLGEYNTLEVLRFKSNGCYLGPIDSEEPINHDEDGILLPGKYIPEGLSVGDHIEVFVSNDSEDRWVATTETPQITLHEFAFLEVKSVTKYGAFMEWGLPKDLVIPFAEQGKKLEVGDWAVIFMYIDEETERLVGTAKINNVVDNEDIIVKEQDEVELMIFQETELGYKAIINDENVGLIYKSDLIDQLAVGDKLKGYVKKIREDNKIDLATQIQGVGIIEPSAQLVLDKLQSAEGQFLPFNDKADPSEIRFYFKMSKKTFKKAIGNLYKQRKIEITDTGIKLI
jgi:predicted RNA-binding protein (virulence factor B family)